MKNDIVAQLKILQRHPRFGARSPEFLAEQRRALMLAIGNNPDAPQRAYGWRDYIAYYREMAGPRFVRNLGGAAAVIAVLMGGWLTTVSAASRSLPGDPLYGLKIVSEQAQLRLASLEQRAILHTEFAERRLYEAAALQDGDTASTEVVLQAVEAFKNEVSSANDDLQALQSSASPSAAATASAVEVKLNQLDAVLDKAVAAVNDEISTEVQEAKDVSREVQSVAVSVIVDDHAAQETVQSQRELKDLFLREYGDVQARQTFDLHRVDVLETAIAANKERLNDAAVLSSDDLRAMRVAIDGIGNDIAATMNSFALGAYRDAFDVLHALDEQLIDIEVTLAASEIAITEAMAAPTNETTDTATPSAPEQD